MYKLHNKFIKLDRVSKFKANNVRDQQFSPLQDWFDISSYGCRVPLRLQRLKIPQDQPGQVL